MALQVNLTYENLFDILVREKTREELQKLEDSFFKDVTTYIQNKKLIVTSDENGRDRLLQQVQNTKRMLRELYERREKKILNMAIVASRTSPSFIDTANMLSVEKKLFESILQQLDLFRSNILQNMLNSKEPMLPDEKQEPLLQDNTLTPNAEPETKMTELQFKSALDMEGNGRFATQDNNHNNDHKAIDPSMKLIKFLKFVPSFVGKELEIYGPFDAEQTARLPPELSDVLISNGSAVEVNGK